MFGEGLLIMTPGANDIRFPASMCREVTRDSAV